MNEKWMKPVELVEILLNFLPVFFVETALFSAFAPLQSTAEGGVFPAASPCAQLLLVLVPLCFWLIRTYASHFWGFVLLHAAVCGLAVWLLGSNLPQRVVFGLFAGIYLLISFRIRFQERREEEGLLGPIAAAIAGAGAFFLCAYLGDGAACGRILKAALLYAFLFFVDTYLRNLDRFVQFNKSSNAHIPVRKMLMRGGGLTAGCSLFVVVLLALGTEQRLMEELGRALGDALLWLAKGIGRLISAILNLFGSEEGEEAVAESVAAVQQFAAAEAAEYPLWMDILLQLIQYLILIVSAAALVFVLYQLIAAAVRRFYEGKTKRPEPGQKEEEIRETLRMEKKSRRKEDSTPLLARTPEEKIRRSFVKAVQRMPRFRDPEGPGQGKRKRDIWKKDARERLVYGKTARELMFLLDNEGQTEEKKAAFWELAGLYEKARYGPGSCSGEDARRAEDCRAILTGRRS